MKPDLSNAAIAELLAEVAGRQEGIRQPVAEMAGREQRAVMITSP